jgi:hypothetical protein
MKRIYEWMESSCTSISSDSMQFFLYNQTCNKRDDLYFTVVTYSQFQTKKNFYFSIKMTEMCGNVINEK